MKHTLWFTSFFPFSEEAEKFCLKKQLQWPWSQLSPQEPKSSSLCRVSSMLPLPSPRLLSWAAHWNCSETFKKNPHAKAQKFWFLWSEPAAQNSPGYSCVARVRLFSRTSCLVPGCSWQCFDLKPFLNEHIPFMEACVCSRGRRKATFRMWGVCLLWYRQLRNLASCQPSLHTYYNSAPSCSSFCCFLPTPGYIIHCFIDWSGVPGPVLVDTPKDSAQAVQVWDSVVGLRWWAVMGTEEPACASLPSDVQMRTSANPSAAQT